MRRATGDGMGAGRSGGSPAARVGGDVGTPARSDGSQATCLDGLDVFQELPAEARAALVARSRVATYPKGAVLAHAGDPIRSVIVVLHGRIKTYRSDAEGEEYLLDVLHDGEAIWHAIFRDDHVYHCSVAALGQVSVCLVPREEFLGLLEEHPTMAMGLILTIGGKLAEAEDRIMTLGIRDPRRRLAAYLMDRDRRCIGPDISLRLDDIASSVGLRPETVSRTITAFEREGLVRRTGRGRLQVADRERLGQVAEAW